MARRGKSDVRRRTQALFIILANCGTASALPAAVRPVARRTSMYGAGATAAVLKGGAQRAGSAKLRRRVLESLGGEVLEA